MQLVNGKSLRQLLDEQKRLSPDLTMHIGACVASALDCAHRRQPRPPRRQAGQHPHHPRRSRAAHRLRHRQGPHRHLRRRPHQPQRHDGHRQVPVARAGARPQARRSCRPLLARARALRVPRRPGALPRRDRRRHGAWRVSTARPPTSPACAPRCRSAWLRSSTSCSPASPTTATPRAPRCAPNCSASPPSHASTTTSAATSPVPATPPPTAQTERTRQHHHRGGHRRHRQRTHRFPVPRGAGAPASLRSAAHRHRSAAAEGRPPGRRRPCAPTARHRPPVRPRPAAESQVRASHRPLDGWSSAACSRPPSSSASSCGSRWAPTAAARPSHRPRPCIPGETTVPTSQPVATAAASSASTRSTRRRRQRERRPRRTGHRRQSRHRSGTPSATATSTWAARAGSGWWSTSAPTATGTLSASTSAARRTSCACYTAARRPGAHIVQWLGLARRLVQRHRCPTACRSRSPPRPDGLLVSFIELGVNNDCANNPYRGGHPRAHVRLTSVQEPLDDRALVAAAQAGDRSALDQLVRAHYDRILGVCRRITGNESDAADAAQEALIAMVRGLTASTAGRRSAPGCTASPPTPASTSCVGGAGGRSRCVRDDDHPAHEPVDPAPASGSTRSATARPRGRAARGARGLPDPGGAARRRPTSTTRRSRPRSACPSAP